MGRWFSRAWRSGWAPLFVVLALLGGWYARNKLAGPRATFELDGDLLISGNPALREVALTFDDGPHSGSMDSILDTLEREQVRATFFVVGKMVEKSPGLVRRMLADGHEVGNHTYTHKRLNQMPLASARQELAACAATVRRATGAEMTLMRPPGMEYNNNVLYLAREMGYVTVHWNVVAADYVPVAPQTIVDRVLRQTKQGSVILLHDSPDTAQALPAIIRQLRHQGYRFATTTQMLARLPRPVIVASNAWALSPDPVLPVVAKAPPRRVARPERAAKPAPTKPRPLAQRGARKSPTDVPVWDGSPPGSPSGRS